VLDHAEVVRLYGPWSRRTPSDAAAQFEGYDGPWWIAGGWAIDAFAGSSREHGDLDIGIPRESLDRFIRFVSPAFDAWAAAGSLTPLHQDVAASPPARFGNVWLRRGGADPWEYDVLLEAVQGDTWEYKRDRRITRPLSDCLWSDGDLTSLRPEVQLLLKAATPRRKDESDLERCLPLLDRDALAWLEDSLRIAHPGHPWAARIADARGRMNR
jgi:hypothetical protein